ncbi:GNAT family N-acetyltransferase [Marinibactrum halimedae]|uniref:N-acetyltransferase domain-containing protein n=1 Tax=Marinibactrum halimedae TaxID=1444977 RepID=A0AA37T1K5_9GAMM|nr:GNAT family N-acetyltransferase [Marinibactrum halimedae]MCD9460282.1 GNAT family N-acetyltransferase [Marinibactrum halimedae]GLS24369.1 hypothetical protein GCM10007877_00800 [Marinibactrum halimedae]
MMHDLPAHPVWAELIRSGSRIYIGSGVGVPNALIDDLLQHSKKFHDIEVIQGYTVSPHRWFDQKYRNLFSINTFYISDDIVRQAVAAGWADYTPTKQSEISSLFTDDTLPLDAALVMVSPPDEYGYCSLGAAVDITMAATRQAKTIIAQINPAMPSTNGYTHIHLSEFAACIKHEQALPEMPIPERSDAIERIGQYLAMLVQHGATLHIGKGKAPSSVLKYLRNHKNLGVHGEMLCDGIMDLFKKGVINNRNKTFHPGKMLAGYCYGSQALYDFVHNNPHIEFYPSGYLESPTNIARNDNMVAINTALEVDLSGQVVTESKGYNFLKGIGSQVDFINGAAKSKGGMPIIAMSSTSQNGKVSRIVSHLSEGSGVVTTRSSVHYVVTEYGIASLKGLSIRERALELIRIAHPNFRQRLLEEVRKKYWVPDYAQRAPKDVPEFGHSQMKPILESGKDYFLRPLNPADERPLQEFFYSHTEESIRLRYNQYRKQLTRENSFHLVSVDQTKDLALCIAYQYASVVKIMAVGRYYFNDRDNTCEVAFITREEYQGKGLATRLLKEMTSIAKCRKIKKMVAYVLPENSPMLHVFDANGFTRILTGKRNEVHLEKQLDKD